MPRLLRRIGILLFAVGAATVSQESDLDELLQWAAAAGADFSKIRVQMVDHGNRTMRGVVAAQDIRDGDVLVSMPAPTVITPHSLRLTAVHGIALEQGFTEWQETVLFIMIERIKAQLRTGPSFWAPYMRVLNHTSVSTASYLWSEQVLPTSTGQIDDKMLQIPDGASEYRIGLVKEVLARQSQVYNKLFPGLVEDYPDAFHYDTDVGKELTSFRAFQWAWEIVSSRFWHLPVWGGDEDKVHVLCPIADMFNHADEEDYHWVSGGFNTRKAAFEIVSHQAYKKGEEICYYYGEHCGEQWDVYYGMQFNLENSCKTRPDHDYLTWAT